MKKYSFDNRRFKRLTESGNRYEIIRDIHKDIEAEVCYVKYEQDSKESGLSLVPVKEIDVITHLSIDEIGEVIHGTENRIPITIWLPCEPKVYNFDIFERCTDKQDISLQIDRDFNSRICVSVTGKLQDGDCIYLPFIKFTDPVGKYFRELTELSDRELKTYKRSEWFHASSVKSLWHYIVHGSLYDPRESKTNGLRFKCQQCAYAWWKYLQRNFSETGKNIYALLRDEVAYSIILDMHNDGGWRHGFWSDDPETHARFHLDGLELFLAQYAITSEPQWLDAACRGFNFVLNNLTDEMDDNLLWFLHDTMEERRNHKFASTIFGKNPYNSLCLNTHTHALRVLYAINKIRPDNSYIEMYEKGMEALKRVLEHQPANFIYNPLIRWVFTDKVRTNRVEGIRKLVTSATLRIKMPLYWYARHKFPRLVQPNGFIERDLSLSYASDRYHITNIKELLKLYKLDGSEWLLNYITDGVRFIEDFISRKGMRNAVKGSPYFIEVVDILNLYSELVEPVSPKYIESIRGEILKESGGCSVEDNDNIPVLSSV